MTEKIKILMVKCDTNCMRAKGLLQHMQISMMHARQLRLWKMTHLFTLQNTDPPVKVKTGDGYGLYIVYYRNRSVASCNRYCKEKRE